jgi:hypothetical protein
MTWTTTFRFNQRTCTNKKPTGASQSVFLRSCLSSVSSDVVQSLLRNPTNATLSVHALNVVQRNAHDFVFLLEFVDAVAQIARV